MKIIDFPCDELVDIDDGLQTNDMMVTNEEIPSQARPPTKNNLGQDDYTY